jgi:hypothetical protein
MTFAVEFRLQPGSKNKIVEVFEQRGPNRNPGVEFLSAWVGLREDIILSIVESPTEEAVIRACQSWSESGEWSIRPVINIEQY